MSWNPTSPCAATGLYGFTNPKNGIGSGRAAVFIAAAGGLSAAAPQRSIAE